MTIELRVINDHFHDNDMVFVYDGKIFFCLTSFAEHLGGEYMDLDSILWYSVKFVFNDRKIPYDEVLDF